MPAVASPDYLGHGHGSGLASGVIGQLLQFVFQVNHFDSSRLIARLLARSFRAGKAPERPGLETAGP